MQLEFPYFITKAAPVSGMTAPMDMDCVYKAEKGEKFKLRITVVVPVQTLCPCSKEISDYGAHNQRAWAKNRNRCERNGLVRRIGTDG